MASETPLEIIEIILSNLRNNVPALTRCSLACREWLFMCRQWLFVNADLTSQGLSSRHARFHKFMDLFELSKPSAPCTLSQHVKCLQLDPGFTPYQIAGLSTIDLPNLHSIRIKPSPTRMPPYLLSAISTTFSEKINSLDVTSLAFQSPLALMEFLCAFPRLQDVALGNNAFAMSSQPLPATIPVLHLASNVKSLRLVQRNGMMHPDVAAWLLGQVKRQGIDIRQLEYDGYSSTIPPDLLAAVAENLEGLDFYFTSSDSMTLRLLSSLDFGLPNLRSLRIMCMLSWVTDWQGVDAALGRLVSSLNATELPAISLAFLSKAPGRWNTTTCPMHLLQHHTQFEELDKALADKENNSLPALRTVEVLVHSCTGMPESRQCSLAKKRSTVHGTGGQDESQAAEQKRPGHTFEGLASNFVKGAFQQTLSARSVTLLVSNALFES